MGNLEIMQKLSIRLIQIHPFYASLLAQMVKIPCETEQLRKQIPTEAVAIENGRINFYYNPKFLETMTVDEAIGVLMHENHHLIYDHLTRMRDEYKENPILANISQDINANRNIQHLPKGCCTVQSITEEFAKRGIKLNLKDDDTSENYYKELNKHSNRYSVETDKDGNMELVIKDPNGKEIGRMKITICNNKDKQSDSKGNGDIPELAKEVIRQAIKEAHDSTMKSQGHLPAGLEQAIEEWLKPPVIPWNVILKNWLVNKFKSGKKNSWKRPNRRFGAEQKGHLPVRIPAITACFDTSGSMSEQDLMLGVSELNGIRTTYKATINVLECDVEVQKEYKLTKYSKPDLKFKGRGGTSFKPIFEYIKGHKIATDICIVFTDMYGDFPSEKPPYPVIWVSTSDVDKSPFGSVLNIQKHPAKEKK
jgi:predicted metal-dependent peptidase